MAEGRWTNRRRVDQTYEWRGCGTRLGEQSATCVDVSCGRPVTNRASHLRFGLSDGHIMPEMEMSTVLQP